MKKNNSLPEVEIDESGIICQACGFDVMVGCMHYHGEWVCNDCGEWTYPFFYDFSGGCEWCGSDNVRYPNENEKSLLDV